MSFIRKYFSIGKSFSFVLLFYSTVHMIHGQPSEGTTWTNIPFQDMPSSIPHAGGAGRVSGLDGIVPARMVGYPGAEELGKGEVAYRNISQVDHLKLAVEWFQKAAAHGNPIAKVDLAIMHFNHEGGLESRASGLALLDEASIRYAPASIILARIFATRSNPEFNPDSALRLARRAASQNEASGAFFLGELLSSDLQGKRDMNSAITAYKRAMYAGNPQAAWHLGEIYRGGLGVPANPAKARDYFSTAAKQNLPAAEVSLGLLYAAGDGVKADLPRAAALWKKAADAESQNGRYLYGLLLLDGRESVKAQPDEAVKYLRLAAESGHAGACATLGTYLAAHPELDTGHWEAYRWLTLAVEGGAANVTEPLAALKTAMRPEEILSAESELAAWRKQNGATATH